MGKKKCFVCLKETHGRSKKDIQLTNVNNSSSSGKETADISSLEKVKNHSDVIFLFRKFLKIPNELCCEFLQNYGDPSVWIHCCDSCLVVVDNAQIVFNKIALLQNKFEKLQTEFKNAIVRSILCNNSKTTNEFKEGVAHKVRQVIINAFKNEKSSTTYISNEDNAEEESFEEMESYLCTDETHEDAEDVKLFDLQEEQKPKIEDDKIPKSKSRKKKISNRKSKEGYSCSVCEETFTAKMQLKRHQKVHFTTEPFSCDECSMSFSRKSGLKKHHKSHMQTEENKKPHSCDECGKWFSDKSVLKRHKKSHVEENKKVKFIVSEESIVSKAEIISTEENQDFCETGMVLGHKIICNTGEKCYSCSICDKKYSTWSHLKRHRMVHTGEKSFRCNICEKKFFTSSHLKRHERIHTGEKPFSCDLCAQTFSDPSTLRKHVRKHTGGKSYCCKICLEGFNELNELNAHEETHTENLDKYKCNSCEMKFGSEKLLKSHARIHKEKQIFSCESCQRAFPTSYHLKRHQLRIHIGGPLNFCDRCGKGFTSVNVLRKHLEKHDKADAFTCQICGDGFADVRIFDRHMKEHTEEKQFPCTSCGKVFFNRQYLKRHEKIHGYKPHSCFICEKSFLNMYSLKRHETTHTGEKPYKCNECEMTLTTSSDLKRHIRRRHPNLILTDESQVQKMPIVLHEVVNENESQKVIEVEVVDEIQSTQTESTTVSVNETETVFELGLGLSLVLSV